MKSFTCVFFQLETRNYLNNDNNNNNSNNTIEIFTLLSGKLLTHVIPQTSIFLTFVVVVVVKDIIVSTNNRNSISAYNDYEHDEFKDIKT